MVGDSEDTHQLATRGTCDQREKEEILFLWQKKQRPNKFTPPIRYGSGERQHPAQADWLQ
jgi:hypothetical protein